MVWTLCEEAAPHLLLFTVGVALIFLAENLATFIKTSKVCLSFDLIKILLGINPKEIIGKMYNGVHYKKLIASLLNDGYKPDLRESVNNKGLLKNNAVSPYRVTKSFSPFLALAGRSEPMM